MEKTKLVYGVEMTSLEEMHFAKFIANKGIAMNTKTKEERYSITKEWLDGHFPEVSKPKTKVQNMNNSEQKPQSCQTSSRSIAVEWWNKLPTSDRFLLLQKYGYQDQKKPWKYRPLTDKGIYLIWCRENGR